MIYPQLKRLKTSRETLDVFRGYNHHLRISDGEFYEMTNLTGQHYPVFSPRGQRGVYASYTDAASPVSMASKDAFIYVSDGELYISRRKVAEGIVGRNLISMGAYLIIMPDKKYVNTNDLDSGAIAIEESNEASSVTYQLCTLEGETDEYVNAYVCAVDPFEETEEVTETEPSESTETETTETTESEKAARDKAYWIDTSVTPAVLKQYSASTELWAVISPTFIKISAEGIGEGFEAGDGVRISGVAASELASLDNAFVTIYACGTDYIVIEGMLTGEVTQTDTPLTVSRKMPEMDFIIESGNRLWGCKYGVVDGEIVNEIYASKLGDFKNWYSFAGISTDSYVASLGSDGQFTGAITHLGYPIFFKENVMHKVYGYAPSNFQIQTTECRGVQKGCSKSLAIVNETLYYKARSAVCAYDGSLPVEVSLPLGDEIYSDATGGSVGNLYYISMKDDDGAYHMFVYDTAKGMWHREDSTNAASFCTHEGNLYYDDKTTHQIKTVRAFTDLQASYEPRYNETSPVKWSAVTGLLGTDTPDKKYISRLDVRLLLTPGAIVTFYVEYDSSGVWEHLQTKSGRNLQTYAVPIRPKRCDHLRLKIVGQGEVKIFSITKTIGQGSDA